MGDKKHRDEEVLKRLYHDKGLSMAEVADRLDTTSGTVCKWMNRLDIDTRDVNSYSPAKKDKMESEKHRQKEWLKKQYIDNGLSTIEMATKANVTASTIVKYMDKYGIDRVEPGGQKNNHAALRTINTGYEMWQSWTESHGYSAVSVHRLMMAAKYGVNALGGMDVHHKNGIPWDNRYDNLELWDSMEHRAHHANNNGLGD